MPLLARLVLVAIALIAAGAVLPEWARFIAIISLAKGLVVLGLIVLWRAGLVSFGQGLFYGLGAYTVGILPQYVPLSDAFVLVAAGAVLAGLVAFILGFLLSRYREIFFAMLCLAFSMILYGILVKSEALGSTDGFHVVAITYLGFAPSQEWSGYALYAFTALVVVAFGGLTRRYLESIMGQLTTAIRDNELRVEYLGFSVRRAVHVKFTMAGAAAGAGGAIAAIAVGHVDPEMVWWIASGEFVFVTILSGAGSVVAPFIGSTVFELLRTMALEYAPNVWQIIVGGTLLGVIMFLPGGLWSLVEKWRGQGSMSVILETRDLNRMFGAVAAAKDINVVVTEGETVGIIGANGAGKTTFVNIVTGYVKPTSGTVLFEGREITHLDPRGVVEAGLARSFQIPQLFASATVFDNLLVAVGVAEAGARPFWQRLREPERIGRCERTLAEFQIDQYRDQPVSTLSQGVRKLLDIAMAMVHGPRLVLLDEPTSGITSEEKFALMDIVVGALREQGLTVLFIEHDMDVVERYADRVMAFYDGAILADGPTAEVLADDGVREFVIGEAPVTEASPMLRIERLDVHIGPIQILEQISMELPTGLLGGLIGRNGAGKTTLMRSLMGLIPASGGHAVYEHHDLMALASHERAGIGVGYMPEDRRLVPEFTTQENLLLPAWSTGLNAIEDRLPWVYGLMPEVEAFKERRANQLSGGQQKMVALARALMCGTHLLLLDEPFEGLAPALARRLAQVIADLKREQVSILLADSNQQHAADLLDVVFHIERGRVAED